MSGERELSGTLTGLEEQLEASRDNLHLRPDNLRRVVDTALSLDHQRTLELVGDERIDAEVFEVPHDLSRSWSRTIDGLVSRLDGTRRNITFDGDALDGRDDLVLTHLGHPLVQRATRNLRAELWSAEPRIHRVSAVVVDGLDESFVAAVARLVLVGASGIRLHEEVFLAGTRLTRRQALGEERAERLLADALDAERLTPVPKDVLGELVLRWNDDAEIRARVETAVRARGERRNSQVVDDLAKREKSDLDRVDEIFRRFSVNLRESLDIAQEQQHRAEGMLFELDDAERRQRERDLREIRSRLDRLDDEREREHEAVRLRYADVTPHTFAGALVFALTPADVAGGLR
jgi:hypothetical protein